MRVLLDTHALPWFALGDLRPSAAALAAIRNPANVILISAATL